MRGRVLHAIHASAYGLTAQEIEDRTGIAGNTVRPRLVELRDAGLIVEGPRFRKTRSGRWAVVWVAVLS